MLQRSSKSIDLARVFTFIECHDWPSLSLLFLPPWWPRSAIDPGNRVPCTLFRNSHNWITRVISLDIEINVRFPLCTNSTAPRGYAIRFARPWSGVIVYSARCSRSIYSSVRSSQWAACSHWKGEWFALLFFLIFIPYVTLRALKRHDSVVMTRKKKKKFTSIFVCVCSFGKIAWTLVASTFDHWKAKHVECKENFDRAAPRPFLSLSLLASCLSRAFAFRNEGNERVSYSWPDPPDQSAAPDLALIRNLLFFSFSIQRITITK